MLGCLEIALIIKIYLSVSLALRSRLADITCQGHVYHDICPRLELKKACFSTSDEPI